MGQSQITQSFDFRVVIAGGGVAALEAAFALRAAAGDRVSVELVAPETDFVYRPLAVAAPFGKGRVRSFPVAQIAAAAGAEMSQDRIASVEVDLHTVTTESGRAIPYDVLLLALGARAVAVLPGAVTFRGPEDERALVAVLAEARAGHPRIAFAIPSGTTWPLPLYELALLTRWHLSESLVQGAAVTLVTPESSPLGLFGHLASEEIGELLAIRGVDVRLDSSPVAFEDGALHLLRGGIVEADAVVALPRLEGIPIPGISANAQGFVETDRYGGVLGVDDVYAVGDMTAFPLKRGGIATQQADAAASAIAVRAGAPIAQEPFRPVIRGLLLTGGAAHYLRADPAGHESAVDLEPLWWPPAKIVGRYLAPYLAERVGIAETPIHEPDVAGVHVDVELEYDEGVLKPVG